MDTDSRSPDQLRWQVTPAFYIALDAAEHIAVEVLGVRVIVPDGGLFAEAARQVKAQQLGKDYSHPSDDAILGAQIAVQAAQQRHDLVRRHIADVAHRLLAPGTFTARAVDDTAEGIADAAMDGMSPIFNQAVASAADTVLAKIVDHPDWRDVIAARATAGTDARTAALLTFIRQIAEMRKDGERDVDGEPYDMEMQISVEEISNLIGEAREILGIPDPDDATAEGPVAQWRWNDHNRPNGLWCRWSKVSAPADRAGSDDQHCPFDCPDSTIEAADPQPVREPKFAAVANLSGPAACDGGQQ